MRKLYPVLIATVLVSGCSGGDGGGTGRLSLSITDAPVDDAAKVVVQFTGVEVKPQGGEAETFTFDEPRAIDLLALQGGDTAPLLEDVELDAGRQEWIRLMVDAEDDGTLDSYIELKDGSQHELYVPSGSQSGLKLVSGVTVPNGGAAAYTLDFDLRKSVHEPMNADDAYVLRPTLRIVQDDDAGILSGSVDASLIGEGCAPAVYVYEGADAVPDDVAGAGVEPVTTANVVLDSGSGEYRYAAAFLEAGDYTAAFTCGADDDDPATDDALTFSGAANVEIRAQQVTDHDFGVPAA